MSRRAGLARALLLAGFLLGGCGGDPFAAEAANRPKHDNLIVGSAASPESEVIAQIYVQALRANGLRARGKPGVGARERSMPALRAGELDVMPEYSGSLLLFLRHDSKATEAATIKTDLDEALRDWRVVAYAPAPASDSDSLVVTKKLAHAWGLRSIADLAGHLGELRIAGMTEFQQRPAGMVGLRKHYGLVFPPEQFVAINDSSGPATIKALREGQVQAADLYTTTPALADGDLVALADPLGSFPSNNIVPVVRAGADSPKLRRILEAVSAQLTTAMLVQLNRDVSGAGKQEPEEAAAAWLAAQGLDRPLPEPAQPQQ